MPFSIRLRLDPIFDEADAPRAKDVVGVEPSFTLRGSPSSKTVRDAAVGGKLEFVGRFASSVRDHPTPDEEPLGKLSGQLTLFRDPPRVEFACDAESLTALTREPAPPASDGSNELPIDFSPRNLRLRLGAGFTGVDSLAGAIPRLFLPEGSGRFHYLEVFVRLSVNGAIEAELEQSDVLDVLIDLPEVLPYPFSI